MKIEATPVRAVRMRTSGASVEYLPGGVVRVRSDEALGPYPKVLTDRLAQWAAFAPERVCFAKRGADGGWVRLTYAQVLAKWGSAKPRSVLIIPTSQYR